MRLDSEKDYYGDQSAMEAAQSYLDNWEHEKHHGLGIGFYSTSQGTGKTFLATWIARKLIRRGEKAYYINFKDIIELYRLPHEERKCLEEKIKDSPVLVLDEVSPAISVAQRELFAVYFEELIRHRSNYNRITILTTNFLPETIADHYERVWSLLSAKEHHVHVNGSDKRQEIWSFNTYLAENGESRPIS